MLTKDIKTQIYYFLMEHQGSYQFDDIRFHRNSHITVKISPKIAEAEGWAFSPIPVVLPDNSMIYFELSEYCRTDYKNKNVSKIEFQIIQR